MSRVCVPVQVLVQVLVLVLVPLLSCSGPLETHGDRRDNQPLKNDILEMLHINRMSARRQNKAHPYMTEVYQVLEGGSDSGQSEATLVQSSRSVEGPGHAPPGWIWFSLKNLQPPVQRAELVLFRKSLHLGPLSVSVTLHGLLASRGTVSEAPPRSRGTVSEAPPRSRGTSSEAPPRSRGTVSEAPPRSRGTSSEAPPLQERLLELNHRPSSGFDVFDVSAWVGGAWVGGGRTELVGFQLRYTDDRGSLVLHEALTQSLYSLDRGAVTEPLLVLYRSSSSSSL